MFTIFRQCAKGPCGPFSCSYGITQVAYLTGRMTRGEPLKLKKGFPYKKKDVTHIDGLLDSTLKRVEEENAKLIVVEGPIASGKSAVIKLLAEEFDMNFIPQPTMDELYVTRTGYDLRQLDDQLPESVRTYDHRNFCMCPKHRMAGAFQTIMLQLRFLQHINAIAHILNTGQGVIMERSPYSEYAFIEAMYSEGFISKNARKYYIQMRDTATPLLLHPHVVIYLDVPVPKVQERIKARNISYEVNSPALTPSFLQKMEDVWKNHYLGEAAKDSEVLIYDWSDGGDVDILIEDLEKLDLDPLKRPDFTQLADWKTWRRDWRYRRITYTSEQLKLLGLINIPAFDVPEFLVPTEDIDFRNELYRQAPGLEYSYGFNPKAGDSLFDVLLGRNIKTSTKPNYYTSNFMA